MKYTYVSFIWLGPKYDQILARSIGLSKRAASYLVKFEQKSCIETPLLMNRLGKPRKI